MVITGSLVPTKFRREIVKAIELDYFLYLPKEYGQEPTNRWPLILFLHGAGERGRDIEMLKKHAIPRQLAAGQELPFIVVAPQCPPDAWWDPQTLSALLDEIEASYAVDKDRVYLTGISMGGFGTWALAAATPKCFAAIVPICGGGEPISTRAIKDVPTWVFHGAKDDIVPLRRSKEMVEALKARGGNVKFTIYPEAMHDSWTETYENPALYEWLLSHRRPS